MCKYIRLIFVSFWVSLNFKDNIITKEIHPKAISTLN